MRVFSLYFIVNGFVLLLSYVLGIAGLFGQDQLLGPDQKTATFITIGVALVSLIGGILAFLGRRESVFCFVLVFLAIVTSVVLRMLGILPGEGRMFGTLIGDLVLVGIIIWYAFRASPKGPKTT